MLFFDLFQYCSLKPFVLSLSKHERLRETPFDKPVLRLTVRPEPVEGGAVSRRA